MQKIRLLLVEDDADLGALLHKYLSVQGLEVTLAVDSNSARELILNHQFDIVVLDVMLPEGDGFMLAETIRKKLPATPFLFLTARRQKEDVIRGLGIGADDYIVKPFDVDELVLRIQNIVRRTSGQVIQQEILQIGRFHFEPAELKLTHGSTSIMLTKKEAGILELIAQKPGRLINRKDVLEKLWGSADYFNGRSLDVYIGRLRKLLEQDPQIRLASIRGSGFVLRINENFI